MSGQDVVAILNELLESEQRSLVHRLLESTVFVGWASADEHAVVVRISDETEEHQAWLADAIFALHGALGPRVSDTDTGDLHYQELHFALPRIIAFEEGVIARYERAAARASSEPAAATTINRILARRRTHLDLLKKMASREASA